MAKVLAFLCGLLLVAMFFGKVFRAIEFKGSVDILPRINTFNEALLACDLLGVGNLLAGMGLLAICWELPSATAQGNAT